MLHFDSGGQISIATIKATTVMIDSTFSSLAFSNEQGNVFVMCHNIWKSKQMLELLCVVVANVSDWLAVCQGWEEGRETRATICAIRAGAYLSLSRTPRPLNLQCRFSS